MKIRTPALAPLLKGLHPPAGGCLGATLSPGVAQGSPFKPCGFSTSLSLSGSGGSPPVRVREERGVGFDPCMLKGKRNEMERRRVSIRTLSYNCFPQHLGASPNTAVYAVAGSTALGSGAVEVARRVPDQTGFGICSVRPSKGVEHDVGRERRRLVLAFCS